MTSIVLLFLFAQPEDLQQQIVRETYHLVSKRDDNVCNFLEGGTYVHFIMKHKRAVLCYHFWLEKRIL